MPNRAAALTCVRLLSLMRSLTRMASCTRSLRSPASVYPRSRNTSPVPASTVSIFFAIAHLVVSTRRFQALMYQVNIRLRGANPGRGFFLKAVQDVHRFREAQRVGHAVGVPAMVLDDPE